MSMAVAVLLPTAWALAAAPPATAATAATEEAPISIQGLAPTPPMGWNSWNQFEKTITAEIVKDQADAMVATGMRDAGYDYVVVDGGWRAASRHPDTREMRGNADFPNMRALADYVHSKGLKFGLHQATGQKDCGGDSPGTATAPGATYADKAAFDARTFARWGVDFLKFDWCGGPPKPDNLTVREWKIRVYRAMGDGLAATGRPILYSVSEYGKHAPWEWAPSAGAHMWRTSNDIKPVWDRVSPDGELRGVVQHIDANAPLAAFASPSRGWNDPDMLEVGVTFNNSLNLTEQQAHFSMWALMASPLIASADLRTLSTRPNIRRILTNREVIAVNQDPLGVQGSRVRDSGSLEVWGKTLANGDRAVALFNRSAAEATISTSTDELGLAPGSYVVRDLWTGTESVTTSAISARVPSHGVVMFRVRPSTTA